MLIPNAMNPAEVNKINFQDLLFQSSWTASMYSDWGNGVGLPNLGALIFKIGP